MRVWRLEAPRGHFYKESLGMHQSKPNVYFLILLSSFKYQPRRILYMLVGVVLLATAIYSSSARGRNDPCSDDFVGGLFESSYHVPNIIHFYRTGKEAFNMSLSDVAVVNAALRHQGPVYIHTENLKATAAAIMRHRLEDQVKLLPAPAGTSLSAPFTILWAYGGIFMKNDVYLIRDVNMLRLREASTTPGGDILALTQAAARSGPTSWHTVDSALYDEDWGALYILEALKNCSIRAVRLGTRN